MKIKEKLKKEFIRLTESTSGSCWALNCMDELINKALKFMDEGYSLDKAVFKTLDQYY